MNSQPNYYKLFKLGDYFTPEDLENGYNNKRNEIAGSMLSDIDKEVYLEQIYRYYLEAKSELRRRYLEEERRYRYNNNYYYDPFRFFRNIQSNLDNFFNMGFDNMYDPNTHRQVRQFQHFEHRLDDGSYLVQHKESHNINGTENIRDENYIRRADGTREYVDHSRVQSLLGDKEKKLLSQ